MIAPVLGERYIRKPAPAGSQEQRIAWARASVTPVLLTVLIEPGEESLRPDEVGVAYHNSPGIFRLTLSELETRWERA